AAGVGLLGGFLATEAKTETVYVDDCGNEEVIETKTGLFGTKTEMYRRDYDD
ncbi:32908_t:CDS:2, partial [Racocetra persica]